MNGDNIKVFLKDIPIYISLIILIIVFILMSHSENTLKTSIKTGYCLT
jgi:hypothetical protein